MRNNLIFGNIAESSDESPVQTEAKLREFMTDKLKMAADLVDQIKFERVHRMKRNTVRSDQSRRPRNIVAKFTLFKDREIVRRLKSKLEGTNFYLHEQYPPEIMERRKKLIPKLKAAKREGKSAWISYDTLYVNGVPVRDRAAD
ncbi:uncharacterized protein LOC128551589 [Mercenaria mercenaria]|uniref:uncharacterized protein LOC128549377 n=1 Tax=Mercenaria mercenaria TaxID=6596 RepID=UPI00234FA609|nr:uncharacterized protein LOC128549377 [Mercenaria mercenaria]XP_053388461.1 uncharacterized protein LOC128551589 [Mercenaria mercenaria]